MLRSSLTLTGLVALAATASAQQLAPASHIRQITAAPRDGGTYHLATGTWTRKAQAANVGADTIYNNTCSTGYYSAFSGDSYVDEGRLPSPSSPSNLNSKPGCATFYTVDGFQLAYCTDQLPATFGTYTINFFQSYATCATAIGVTPTAGFALTGLPAATGASAQCWIVNIDLDAPPQTASLAFNMLADGDGSYAGAENTNLFGWAMSSTAPGTGTGPLIAGDPATCTRYDGTRWDPVVNYAEAGTGMGTQDAFRIEGGPTTAGCYWFGGAPFGSFWLRLFADACGPVQVGTVFCIGDGVAPHTACPCGNNSTTAAAAGCLNSFGVGSALRAVGNAQISNDTVVLSANGLPLSSVLFFQGTIQQNSGNGSVFGDGLRCAGGTVIRLATHNATGTAGAATSGYPLTGEPSVSVRGLVTAAGTRTYQAWYRNSAAFCTSSVFNLSNGLEITWAP
jgi:hypothetical protein